MFPGVIVTVVGNVGAPVLTGVGVGGVRLSLPPAVVGISITC